MPEHCQIYPLSFDGMKGAKTSGVHDWQVFEILGEIFKARSDCPNNKNCTARTLHRNGPGRLPYAGRVWLPSQMMIRYVTITIYSRIWVTHNTYPAHNSLTDM